jgi:hypothetical protein
MSDAEKPDWQKYWDEREPTRENAEQYFRVMTNDLRSPLAISLTKAALIKRLVAKLAQGEISLEELEKKVDELVEWNSHVIDLYNDVSNIAEEWLNRVQNSKTE